MDTTEILFFYKKNLQITIVQFRITALIIYLLTPRYHAPIEFKVDRYWLFQSSTLSTRSEKQWRSQDPKTEGADLASKRPNQQAHNIKIEREPTTMHI
jgi:hypothetical protein